MEEARTNNDQEDLKRLILLAKEGDKQAFEEVYTTYYTPLYRYIISRIKDKQEAEDMTQTVFMKIWNAMPSWNPNHTSPLSFFFTIARNTMIDHFRKKSHHKEIVSDDAIKDFGEQESYSDKESEMRELREALASLILQLSPGEQEIIGLYYTNDLSYKEIAAITGKREDAIRQIHSRAIKKLRSSYRF